jgi:hypothetical protein
MREFNEKCKIYLLLFTNLCSYDSTTIIAPKIVLPHHAGKSFASNHRFFSHDFSLIASVVGESVIGHGIGGINLPDNMVRLAKMQDCWSKRRQTLCIT